MEYLKLFISCCLIVKIVTAKLTELRVASPITTNDVIEVMRSAERLNEFKRVYEFLDENSPYKTNINVSAGKYSTSELLNRMFLKPMGHTFMVSSSQYFMLILREYMEIAVRLLNDQSLLGVSEIQKREVVKFDNELEYCMLTAFFDWGAGVDICHVELLFESFYFLQTIVADAESSIKDLEFKLQSYHRRYDVILRSRNPNGLRNRFAAVPTSTFTKYSKTLSAIKKEFGNLSYAFCSTWTPYVRRDLLRAETQSNYVQDLQSSLVRYTFLHETCEINFQQRSDVPNQISEFADYKRIQEENQQNQITTWDCKMILDSPEYRYQTNIADVAPKGSIKKFFSVKKISGRRSPPKPSKPAAAKAFKDKQIITLATLRNALKSNNHYLNAVKYYNIVADVMLLVAIKEGNKMLRGIKLTLAKKCAKKPVELRGDEVRRMRSALHAFKSVLDRLVSLILQKRRINVADSVHKKTFDTRVGSVMELLDANNDWMADDRAERICVEIPEVLEAIKDHGYIDDPLKFVSFYFAESILNVRKLYHFGENDF